MSSATAWPEIDLSQILRQTVMPAIGILCFLLFWQLSARNIDTSLGKFPGPGDVWQQVHNLYGEHVEERKKASAFYLRQKERNAEKLASDPSFVARKMSYTGKPTFLDQIGTSLYTVLSGFLLASLIAIPLGIMIGLSSNLYASINPLMQLLKPVSPLAWLPLVTMVVSASYVTDDPAFSKSFLNSLLTVSLCSIWPTLINTALGVTSVSADWNNVSKVLRLGWFTHVKKIILPAAIPMMFTGLRLSLGTAWMVLIAAEMLAQNPGLGKFVWDEFQNGSSSSLGRIMTAVIVIGFIGFLLDRGMLLLQRYLSWDKSSEIR